MTSTTLRTAFGTGLAVAALAAVLAGCDGSAYSGSGYDDGWGYSDSDSDTGFESDSESRSVVFGTDGDSLTTLPGGGFSFSGSDGSSFSSG